MCKTSRRLEERADEKAKKGGAREPKTIGRQAKPHRIRAAESRVATGDWQLATRRKRTDRTIKSALLEHDERRK